MRSKSMVKLGAAASALLVAAGVWAASGKLNPEFSAPSKGTPDAPAAEAGVKPESSAPWSVTTLTSSVKGKPVPGKPVSTVGEIVDLSCYLQVGKHGDKHRE